MDDELLPQRRGLLRRRALHGKRVLWIRGHEGGAGVCGSGA